MSCVANCEKRTVKDNNRVTREKKLNPFEIEIHNENTIASIVALKLLLPMKI